MSRIPKLPDGYRLHRYSQYPEGRYQLIECIASGGFGITYRAFDPKHQCEVVIKELCMECYMKRSPGNVSFEPLSNRDGDEVQVFDRVRRRFYREAKVLNGLRHHNIVRVVKFFGENNTYYYGVGNLEPEEFIKGGCVDLETYALDLLERRGCVMADSENGFISRNGEPFHHERTSPRGYDIQMQ